LVDAVITDALSERVAARVAWRFNALAKHHGLSALAYAGTPAAVPLVIAGLEPAAGNRWRLDRDRLLDAAQITFPQAWQFDAELHAVQDVFRCELELV
jgi:hypothetical protein